MMKRSGEDLRNLCVIELVSLCAADTGNAQIWTEFLRRFEPRIKSFIRKTLLRYWNGTVHTPDKSLITGKNEENDLFQSTILRLVDNDCGLMKRFMGSEDEFVAYLAVVSESVVRDSLRRRRAVKRPNEHRRYDSDSLDFGNLENSKGARREEPVAERRLLAKEVWNICLRSIKKLPGSPRTRNRQIFELYFSRGFSVHEIARVKEIGLSKTGVENVLNRLKDRVHGIVSGKSAQE